MAGIVREVARHAPAGTAPRHLHGARPVRRRAGANLAPRHVP
jgi:hypothetical protein